MATTPSLVSLNIPLVLLASTTAEPENTPDWLLGGYRAMGWSVQWYRSSEVA